LSFETASSRLSARDDGQSRIPHAAWPPIPLLFQLFF
jgi:hypothetical protein